VHPSLFLGCGKFLLSTSCSGALRLSHIFTTISALEISYHSCCLSR